MTESKVMERRSKNKNTFHNFSERQYSSQDFANFENALLGNTPPPVKKGEPFIKIPKKIFDCNISKGAKYLYIHMKSLEDKYRAKGQSFFHSQDDLSKELQQDKKTTRKQLKELLQAGILKTTVKGGTREDNTKIKKATYYKFINGF